MKNKIRLSISLLFGLMFINSGFNKFFNYMPLPDDLPESMLKIMEAFMTIAWLMPLIGAVEIIAGIFFIFPKTRALGALIIFPIMIGILLTHIFNAPTGLPIAIILLMINLWVMYENKEKLLPLIK